ncbi:MAG TPA: BtpA/SgcQ family protein [Patescibacteria group bacterium]
MTNFKEVFQNKHVVLPVVHVETGIQTLKNAHIAFKAGADGVFLISMNGMNHYDLLQIQKQTRQEFSTWWIGINYLDLSTISAFKNVDAGVSGLWTDNARIYEWSDKQIEADQINIAREKSGWPGLYFGGVAFKYQYLVKDPALAAKIATKYVDVVTTSGTMTGIAPDIQKIKSMKKAMGDFPLAIASGVSPQNVEQFLDHADCFLVATSLLKPNAEEFDPGKVKDLVEIVQKK